MTLIQCMPLKMMIIAKRSPQTDDTKHRGLCCYVNQIQYHRASVFLQNDGQGMVLKSNSKKVPKL